MPAGTVPHATAQLMPPICDTVTCPNPGCFRRPTVIGGIGWMDDGSDCPAGSTSDISACDRYCEFTVPDDSDNQTVFRGQKGQWGVWSHEATYRLHVFRAGSEPGS